MTRVSIAGGLKFQPIMPPNASQSGNRQPDLLRSRSMGLSDRYESNTLIEEDVLAIFYEHT